MSTRLELTRRHLLSFRLRMNALTDPRPALTDASLSRATLAGLQDSMPRAALLSLHARLKDVKEDVLSDSRLIQIWGPRFGTYVLSAGDVGIFTVGRTSDRAQRRDLGTDLAERLEQLLGDEEISYAEAGRAIGVSPNSLRYAAPTGRVAIRWGGAGRPTIRMLPVPNLDVSEARQLLLTRYLHVFGPSDPRSFSGWAGVPTRVGAAIFETIEDQLIPVSTPVGDRWMLESDEADMRRPVDARPTRLLPSGDAYTLAWDDDRRLLVEDSQRQQSLWTPRVWPGAIMVNGDIVGTWRRSKGNVELEPWTGLPKAAKLALEQEAMSFPLPGADLPVTVSWM